MGHSVEACHEIYGPLKYTVPTCIFWPCPSPCLRPSLTQNLVPYPKFVVYTYGGHVGGNVYVVTRFSSVWFPIIQYPAAKQSLFYSAYSHAVDAFAYATYGCLLHLRRCLRNLRLTFLGATVSILNIKIGNTNCVSSNSLQRTQGRN